MERAIPTAPRPQDYRAPSRFELEDQQHQANASAEALKTIENLYKFQIGRRVLCDGAGATGPTGPVGSGIPNAYPMAINSPLDRARMPEGQFGDGDVLPGEALSTSGAYPIAINSPLDKIGMPDAQMEADAIGAAMVTDDSDAFFTPREPATYMNAAEVLAGSRG